MLIGVVNAYFGNYISTEFNNITDKIRMIIPVENNTIEDIIICKINTNHTSQSYYIVDSEVDYIMEDYFETHYIDDIHNNVKILVNEFSDKKKHFKGENIIKMTLYDDDSVYISASNGKIIKTEFYLQRDSYSQQSDVEIDSRIIETQLFSWLSNIGNFGNKSHILKIYYQDDKPIIFRLKISVYGTLDIIYL